jgi:hypothetical protein
MIFFFLAVRVSRYDFNNKIMKNLNKIILSGFVLLFSQIGFGQVKINSYGSTSNIASGTQFIDASGSLGKGLVFSRTDLTTLMSLSGSSVNKMDGMLVYNTATGTSGIGAVAVKPGFYYYKNTSSTLNGGTWIPVGSDAIPAASNPIVVTVSDDYVILDTDSTILCNTATKAISLTLPVAAAGNSGKTFVISRLDNIASNLLSFSQGLKLVGGATVSSLNYARTLRIQSDGTNWNVID